MRGFLRWWPLKVSAKSRRIFPSRSILKPSFSRSGRFGGGWKYSLVEMSLVRAMKFFPALRNTSALLALTSSLLASMPGETAPLITRIENPISVPAEISGHQMFVNVMVNGRGPFRVIVDTGCSFTLLSPEMAAAVGAVVPDQDDDAISALNGLGDYTDVQRVVLGTVYLGGVCFEGVPAAVSDSFDKLSRIGGLRVDGALGFPLFSDLFLGLDFPNRRLLLSSKWPGNLPPIRASLPVTEHADVPYVQSLVQGKPIDLMIDTGANQALQIPVDLVPSFQWKQAPRAGSLVAVIGEVGREGIGRLAGNLTLGGVREIEPLTVISSGNSSLGVRSLERFCVIFHRSEGRMWLCSPDAAPLPPLPERTDGLSVYADAGGWRIAGVIPGSPADAAHVAVGALVTQIEKKPAIGWTRDQIDQWVDSHATIALTVADESGEHALTLSTWDLVP